MFEPYEWETWAPVERFASAVGRNPGIVLIYSGWPEPWQAKFAAMAYAHGAEPFVQIEPVGVTLRSIIAGDSDAYLRSYAASVRRYGHPVILSFGAEMNGSWYSWGSGHTRPDVFVAARRQRLPQSWRSQREVALDGQQHQRHGRTAEALVARGQLREHRRDRWLLLPAG